MIKMIAQPIVNLVTKEIFMEEWLCRPNDHSIEEYFAESDPFLLWLKESVCIREAILTPSPYPKSINLTLSSLPYFLETNWTWKGCLELVEWGPRQQVVIKLLPKLIQQLKERGLDVFVDDVTPQTWLLWKYQKVDGYKVRWEDVHGKENFLKEMKARKKPIVLERIENEEIEKEALRLGVDFGQGWLYKQPHVVEEGKLGLGLG